MRIDLSEAFGLDPNIIAILKEKYGAQLLPIQEKAFKTHQIMRGGNLLISAVTSSGKTLVGKILALHYGSKGKRVFYLVPTKALAEEKFEQFHEDYEKAGIQTVISTHDRRKYDERIEGRWEEMTPALNRKEMDRHILNLVASEICRDAGEIKTFLKGAFTDQTLWKSEITDADYDKAIEETIVLSVKWGLIEKTAKERLIPTPLGKNTAAKGIALETAVFFLI